MLLNKNCQNFSQKLANFLIETDKIFKSLATIGVLLVTIEKTAVSIKDDEREWNYVHEMEKLGVALEVE